MIELVCSCGRTLKFRDELRGRSGRCRDCGTTVLIESGPIAELSDQQVDLLTLLEGSISNESLGNYGDFSEEISTKQKADAERKKIEKEKSKAEKKARKQIRDQRLQVTLFIAVIPVLYLALTPFINLVMLSYYKHASGGLYSEMPAWLWGHGVLSCIILVCWIVAAIFGTKAAASGTKANGPAIAGCATGFVMCFILLTVTIDALRIDKHAELNQASLNRILPELKSDLPDLIAKCRGLGECDSQQLRGKFLVMNSINGREFFTPMFDDVSGRAVLGSRYAGFVELESAGPDNPTIVAVLLSQRPGGSEITLYVDGNESMPVQSAGCLVDFAVIRFPDRQPLGILTFEVPPKPFASFPSYSYDRNNPPSTRADFDPIRNEDKQLIGNWFSRFSL